MKNKILISAVSAIVLLTAGLLLKSNYDSNRTFFLNQNIEALAKGDYSLKDCRIGMLFSNNREWGIYCHPSTVDHQDYFDCMNEIQHLTPTCEFSVCVKK